MGIPEDVQDKVFERFYRVDKARSRAVGGAGLGLAICERILQLYHIEMSFYSKPGSGTTVKLFFPVE